MSRIIEKGRDGALRRPRRVQRRNADSVVTGYATLIGRSGNSARWFAGGDVAARRPYHTPI